MLYLYNIYNVDRICIYVLKSPCQTSSPSRVEAKDRCLANLNVEYIGQCGDDTDLHATDNAFEGTS